MAKVGGNRYLYSKEARQRAITSLSLAVEHDSWGPVRQTVAAALKQLGDASVAGLLERTASTELDDGVKRGLRLAAFSLRTGDKENEQGKQLRKDLDEIREENRKLKDQLNSLEARLK